MPELELKDLTAYQRARLEELRQLQGFSDEQQAAQWALKKVLSDLPPLMTLRQPPQKNKNEA